MCSRLEIELGLQQDVIHVQQLAAPSTPSAPDLIPSISKAQTSVHPSNSNHSTTTQTSESRAADAETLFFSSPTPAHSTMPSPRCDPFDFDDSNNCWVEEFVCLPPNAVNLQQQSQVLPAALCCAALNHSEVFFALKSDVETTPTLLLLGTQVRWGSEFDGGGRRVAA